MNPNEASVNHFIDWVGSNDPSRPIKSHYSWAKCAVGDYAYEVFGEEIKEEDRGSSSIVLQSIYNSDFLNYGEGVIEDNAVVDFLSGHMSFDYEDFLDFSVHETDTYGELYNAICAYKEYLKS